MRTKGRDQGHTWGLLTRRMKALSVAVSSSCPCASFCNSFTFCHHRQHEIWIYVGSEIEIFYEKTNHDVILGAILCGARSWTSVILVCPFHLRIFCE